MCWLHGVDGLGDDICSGEPSFTVINLVSVVSLSGWFFGGQISIMMVDWMCRQAMEGCWVCRFVPTGSQIKLDDSEVIG